MTLQVAEIDAAFVADALPGVPYDRQYTYGYGSDVIVFTEADTLMRCHAEDDRRVPVYDLVRRLQTRQGTFDTEPEYGFDIEGFIHHAALPSQFQRIEDGIREQAAQVAGIRRVDVRVDATTASLRVRVSVHVRDAGTPFPLVFFLDESTLKILEAT